MGTRPLVLAFLNRRHNLPGALEIARLGSAKRSVPTPARRVPFRVARPVQGDGKATPGRAPRGQTNIAVAMDTGDIGVRPVLARRVVPDATEAERPACHAVGLAMRGRLVVLPVIAVIRGGRPVQPEPGARRGEPP